MKIFPLISQHANIESGCSCSPKSHIHPESPMPNIFCLIIPFNHSRASLFVRSIKGIRDDLFKWIKFPHLILILNTLFVQLHYIMAFLAQERG